MKIIDEQREYFKKNGFEIPAVWSDFMNKLEQSLSKDKYCKPDEHEWESCPAVKCEKCGLIIED